jgi:predicted metal-binding membrane protein
MWVRAVLSLLREPPWPTLIGVTACGWASIAFTDDATTMASLCGTADNVRFTEGGHALEVALLFASPSRLAASWLLMLVAMMTPLLATPFHHLWVRSLARRRWRAIAVFLMGYLAIWMSAAPIMATAAIVLRMAADRAGVSTLFAVLVVVCAWQASPWKQACLNRCHWTPRLSVFGVAADADCLRYGIAYACRCVGTCWALMLAPLTAGHVHLPVMAVAAAVMIVERLRPARPARWRLPAFGMLPS